MPELPEVETIKRVIEPQIQGLTVTGVTVKRPEVVAYPSADTFCGLLMGQTIFHMTRRGKFLSIVLDNGDRVTLHLRMTGCLLLTPADFAEEKHTHIILRLSSGMELRFSDTRRFGRFWLIQKAETDNERHDIPIRIFSSRYADSLHHRLFPQILQILSFYKSPRHGTAHVK